MIQIPTSLIAAYSTFIARNGVPSDQHRYYIKWLRYFCDFCRKYNFRQEGEKILAAFMDKLKEKRQAENMRRQARHAVSLFFEMNRSPAEKSQNDSSLQKLPYLNKLQLMLPSAY